MVRPGRWPRWKQLENKLYIYQLEELNYGLTSIVSHFWPMSPASTLDASCSPYICCVCVFFDYVCMVQ